MTAATEVVKSATAVTLVSIGPLVYEELSSEYWRNVDIDMFLFKEAPSKDIG